jgi:DNA polymerase III subunit delta
MKKTPKKTSSRDQQTETPEGVYLLFGDEFLVKERLNNLVDSLLSPELRGTNLTVFDGANPDVSKISTHVFTPSLFGGSRVIIIDQTALFMGRTDQRKLLGKALESWKSGQRKSALRSFSQLLGIAGVSLEDLKTGAYWVQEIAGDSTSSEEKDGLLRIAQAYLEESPSARRGGDEERLMEELISSSFPEGTTLIFTAPGADKRKKIFKTLEKHGSVIECAVREQKYGAGMERSFFNDRVHDALLRAGKEIDPSALEKMYGRSGKEVRRLQSELDKLIGYVGDRKKITAADVDAIFGDFHDAVFFDLMNAARSQDLAKSLRALHDNLRNVSHPLQILGAFASDFRKLMVGRELLFSVFRKHWKPRMSYESFMQALNTVRAENPQLKGKGKFDLLSMKDYPLYFLLRDAQRFTMEKLIQIMEAILEADMLMKSSRVGSRAPATILEELILKICER